MANNVDALQNLPEIDFLSDLNISQETIAQEMIEDYQDKYEELTGNEITLYPANSERLKMQIVAGELYQTYEFISYLFSQNFIQYMERNVLENWGATLGYAQTNIKAATCILQFKVNEVLDFDVEIPAGIRATAGDDVYFATNESCVLKAGESSVEVSATCTEEGTIGNDYVVSQINVLADPVLNISGVENCTTSQGGQDEYDDETLRENIFLFPSTYSTAGPNTAYEYFVKSYSTEIISVNVIQNNVTAEVDIYIMLADGKVPDEQYCKAVVDYLVGLECTPADDKIYVNPPEIVQYKISGKYYIAKSSRENEALIKESVLEAANYFVSECHENIGNDIIPDKLIELTRIAGAKRLELTSPDFIQVSETQIAICDGIELSYGGLEDD